MQGRCSCGSVDIQVMKPAIVRMFCHCTLCQEYNNAPFADVSMFHARDVADFDDNKIQYKYYKKPELIPRGSCKQCNDPVLEKVRLKMMPNLIVVPSNNFDDMSWLPQPSMHMFYDKRVADVDDNLKKCNGMVSSQLVFGFKLIRGLIAHSKV